jgi:hypothetical protein
MMDQHYVGRCGKAWMIFTMNMMITVLIMVLIMMMAKFENVAQAAKSNRGSRMTSKLGSDARRTVPGWPGLPRLRNPNTPQLSGSDDELWDG